MVRDGAGAGPEEEWSCRLSSRRSCSRSPACSGRRRRRSPRRARPPPRRAGGRGEPGGPDRDGHLRPGPDLGGRAARAGSATAATTAPGSRCPGTSATRWPSRTTARRRTDGHAADAGRPDGTPRHGGTAMTPQEAMGHGGHDAGMSMDDMVARHAQPVPGRRGAVGADPAVVADRPGGARLHRAGAVRAARRRVLAAAVAAGDLLLGLDLLRRRLAGAAGPDAGHDGAGRRRGRRRLAVQRWWSRSPAAARSSTRPPRC